MEFQGDDATRAVFPSILGHLRHQGVRCNRWYGSKRSICRGEVLARYAIEYGIVTHGEICATPEERMLVTEATLNPKANHEKMTPIMFETVNAPVFYVAIQAYATGYTPGIILDADDSVSHTVTTYEGYCLPNTVLRLDWVGRILLIMFEIIFQNENEFENKILNYEYKYSIGDNFNGLLCPLPIPTPAPCLTTLNFIASRIGLRGKLVLKGVFDIVYGEYCFDYDLDDGCKCGLNEKFIISVCFLFSFSFCTRQSDSSDSSNNNNENISTKLPQVEGEGERESLHNNRTTARLCGVLSFAFCLIVF